MDKERLKGGTEKWRVFLAGLAVFAATLPVLAQEEREDETPISSAGGELLDDELTFEPTLTPEPPTPTPTATLTPTPTRVPTPTTALLYEGNWLGQTSQSTPRIRPIMFIVGDNSVHTAEINLMVVTGCGTDEGTYTFRSAPPAVITDSNFSLNSSVDTTYAGPLPGGSGDPYSININMRGRFESPTSALGELDIHVPGSARGCGGSTSATWNANKK